MSSSHIISRQKNLYSSKFDQKKQFEVKENHKNHKNPKKKKIIDGNIESSSYGLFFDYSGCSNIEALVKDTVNQSSNPKLAQVHRGDLKSSSIGREAGNL
jgi:hypothetical protein